MPRAPLDIMRVITPHDGARGGHTVAAYDPPRALLALFLFGRNNTLGCAGHGGAAASWCFDESGSI
jgi:hypothetical protein